jgi:hypothetical protein
VGDDIALSPAAPPCCALDCFAPADSSADDLAHDAAGASVMASAIASVREARRFGIGDLWEKKGCMEAGESGC